MLKAIEFFSGIGAFAEALAHGGNQDSGNGGEPTLARNNSGSSAEIRIIAAFDQSGPANETYEYNFRLKPSNRNLDSIKVDEIPEADVWWMSPPCAPYTVRGKQRDVSDPRAASFLNLITIAQQRKPNFILVENVMGFSHSEARNKFMETLALCGYSFHEYDLCSTNFSVPMKRTRHYMIASKVRFDSSAMPQPPTTGALKSLLLFIGAADEGLSMAPNVMARYGEGFHIVDPHVSEEPVTCFTRNYARCMRASGSLLMSEGIIRRFSPEEILKFLGFSDNYRFPETIDRETRWRLVGNSVDVRAIRFLLDALRPVVQSHSS